MQNIGRSNRQNRLLSKTVRQATAAHRDATGKLSFSGTIMLGRAVERDAAGNKEQPFSGIAGWGYDARIGVLECPITTNQDTFQNQVDNLILTASRPGCRCLSTIQSSVCPVIIWATKGRTATPQQSKT